MGADRASTQVSHDEIEIEAPGEKKDDTPDVVKKMESGSFQASTKWRAGGGDPSGSSPGDGGGGGGSLAKLAGKYVPPSQRRGAGSVNMAGSTMPAMSDGFEGDDAASLRVTNISEDTDEADLKVPSCSLIQLIRNLANR